MAQSLTPRAALERLFTSPKPEAAWFRPEFLAQLPIDQIEGVMVTLKTSFGAYQKVRPLEEMATMGR